MMQVRRAPHLHISLERRPAFNLSGLLKGDLDVVDQDAIVASSGDFSNEILIDQLELAVLANTDSESWEAAAELALRCSVESKVISDLIDSGLLEARDQDDQDGQVRSDALDMWDPSALFYHKRSMWQGRGEGSHLPATAEAAEVFAKDSPGVFSEIARKHGDPPVQFHDRVPAQDRIGLEENSYHSSLTETLKARRTSRIFDLEQPLGKSAFSTVMNTVFGCQGFAQLSDKVVGLKKTSPSGGAMHPVEVYPLVISVDGIAPGLYHYHVGDHALEPLKSMTTEAARKLARLYTAGQNYFSTAHVLLVYTARYNRSFWKYRRHRKAYKVIQIDAGHLSQTLYLLCTEMGLGAFFTAACNDSDIETQLGLDGITEGVVALGGFGIPDTGDDALAFPAIEYKAGITKI